MKDLLLQAGVRALEGVRDDDMDLVIQQLDIMTDSLKEMKHVMARMHGE